MSLRVLTARNARRIEGKRKAKLGGVVDQIRHHLARKSPLHEVVLTVPHGQSIVAGGDYYLTKITPGVTDWRVFGRRVDAIDEIDLTAVVVAGGVSIAVRKVR